MKDGWVDTAGRQAGLLSVVEVGLGSLLHGLRVPFGGHFLSLNQGFLLSRAVIRRPEAPRTLPATISNVAAVLKSLSPAGRKLTPMLAISAQGLLFSLGITLFGINPVGVIVGLLLLSVWAFLQPLLIYYLLYGKALVEMGAYFLESLRKHLSVAEGDLWLVAAAVVGLKALFALLVAWAAYRLPEGRARAYETKLAGLGRARARGSAEPRPQGGFGRQAALALRDLCHPLFLLSLAVTALFFLYVESDRTRLVWVLLRPVAVGFILFFVVRCFPFERWLRPETAFGRALGTALGSLRGSGPETPSPPEHRPPPPP